MLDAGGRVGQIASEGARRFRAAFVILDEISEKWVLHLKVAEINIAL